MVYNSGGFVLTTYETVVFENWNGSTFPRKLEEIMVVPVENQ